MGTAAGQAGILSRQASGQNQIQATQKSQRENPMTDAPADPKTTPLTRTYDAPASLVFDCCLKPEHLVHWYNAGDGWTTPSAETDPRPGGRFNIRFQGP